MNNKHITIPFIRKLLEGKPEAEIIQAEMRLWQLTHLLEDTDLTMGSP